MLLGTNMSKRKGRFSNKKLPHEVSFSTVHHDNSLDPDPREQGYWEWFEKMNKEKPTPEEMQAYISEREKIRAEVLERREELKFWEDRIERNCEGAPEGTAACLQRQYELMKEKYPDGVPAEVIAKQVKLHPAHIGFAKNPFEEIDMQAFRLAYKIAEEIKK